MLSVVRELRIARLSHSLDQADVARFAGISPSRYSRIERGEIRDLTIGQATILLAGVGLRLSTRAYPAGQPIRDAAHVALLRRLRMLLHPSLTWRTEVPLPIPGDLRAWDAMITGEAWVVGVEAETRPRDAQALRRRIALKQRDGDVACVILLLADTRHNRALVREYASDLANDFPLPGPRALEFLRVGANPGASAVILV